MNSLTDAYGDKGLVCLGFPSNQFGHQTNNSNDEILDNLKHVRPGKGCKPNFPMFARRVDINGADELPLFMYLKEQIPVPEGPTGETLMVDPKLIVWSPVKRNDVSWNF